LVIGAGPAGSSAAVAAATAGAHVILMERKTEVGSPVQCAEYIPFQIAHELQLGADIAAQRIDMMRTHLPDGEVIETPSKGIICHRDLFDRHLAGVAEKAGARLMTGTNATGFDGRAVTSINGGSQINISAKVIIGTDGPASIVRKWMGLPGNEMVRARQHLLPLAHRLDATEIFFSGEMPGGYGWVFPKGETANVGIGIDPRRGISSAGALEDFKQQLLDEGVIAGGNPLSATGGLIPVGGQSRLWQNNLLLAGDAAGHCHPVTGAGVPNAIFTGGLAGEAAASAALSGDRRVLADYEQSCRLFLGDTLAHAAAKRRFLEPFWDQDEDALSRALRKSWIAFEGYYEN